MYLLLLYIPGVPLRVLPQLFDYKWDSSRSESMITIATASILTSKIITTTSIITPTIQFSRP